MSEQQPIVNAKDHLVSMEAQAPAWLQKHALNGMQLAFALLGEAADQEPGGNMDQAAVILTRLSPDDLGNLIKIFSVPPVPEDVLAQLPPA